MNFRTKVFLALSVLLVAFSYTPFGSETLHGIPKPLGVIFFGLFLITWAFPRRMFDQLDRDQALRHELIKKERRERRRHRREHRAHSRVHWKPRHA